LPGGTASFGLAVNASGQVAGYSGTASGFSHAFISEANGGPLRDLGTLGGRFSFGRAINASGQVTGRSETAGFAQHAFRSGPNGGPLLDLSTLGGPSSFGQAINTGGEVVGYSYLSDNSTQRAFLYTTAMGMIDLNAHLVPGSGWTLTDARGINDRGQITGVGMVGGTMHGFLLTLVPSDFRITSITALGKGNVLVSGVGTPFRTYAVQAAQDVRGPFVQIATIVATSDGTLQHVDADATNFTRRFYRFATP
jgi:probable HAF family extracellular repeat protein